LGPGTDDCPACGFPLLAAAFGTVNLTVAGRSVELAAGERVVLGRDQTESPLAGLLAGMYGVSRRHASVTVRGGSAVIEDLGSTNGTWLDGERLGREPVVRPLPVAFRLGQAVEVQVGTFGGGSVLPRDDVPASEDALARGGERSEP
jgi:hypothetical protein